MPAPTAEAERILKALAVAAFLVFFGGYMLAPLIPALSREFADTPQKLGLVVPAYMIPYGVSTLFYGPLSDRVGRRGVLLTLLAIAIFSSAALSLARDANQLIGLRVLAGLCGGGIVPIALALVGDLYPYQSVGRAIGWIFGGIAGGMAFGSTLGAWLNPSLGWRNECVALAAANTLVFAYLVRHRRLLQGPPPVAGPPARVLADYAALLRDPRGRRTYAFIFLNGVFHSGLFSWLGYYLSRRYRLDDVHIGTALLGYGVPGMLLGPYFGRLADRHGRHRVIPAGFLLAAACAYLLAPRGPLWLVMATVTALSVGLDMTQPPMVGIVTNLDPRRRGQAMGLNAFALFTGFGVGAYAFRCLLPDGFTAALIAFGAAQTILALAAWRAFGRERPSLG